LLRFEYIQEVIEIFRKESVVAVVALVADPVHTPGGYFNPDTRSLKFQYLNEEMYKDYPMNILSGSPVFSTLKTDGMGFCYPEFCHDNIRSL